MRSERYDIKELLAKLQHDEKLSEKDRLLMKELIETLLDIKLEIERVI